MINMTQEDKKLLISDLCARLKCGVIAMENEDEPPFKIVAYDGLDFIDDGDWEHRVEKIKPYLFPLSSMTEEQKEELINITNGKFRYMCGDITNAIPRKNISEWGISENAYINSIKVINILYIWLLKNHFDINGLIPMSLAIDATTTNIYLTYNRI